MGIAFDRNLTFETLNRTTENDVPLKFAKIVATDLGSVFSPVWISGGEAIERTHLLHAFGNQASVNHPGIDMLFISGEELCAALGGPEVSESIERLQSCRLLMIDDAARLMRTQEQQDVLCDILLALHKRGGMLVLTSRLEWSDMTGVDGRLALQLSKGQQLPLVWMGLEAPASDESGDTP